MRELTPEKASIFRITHLANVPWILDNGLHCRNSLHHDPNFVEIGNPDLITKRTVREVPELPNGVLSDYIPFYFTPLSPMLMNIATGYRGIQKRSNDEIVILISSLHKLQRDGVPFLFTDRHAYLAAAKFSSDLDNLKDIDWQNLQNRDFRKDHEEPDKFERYQAEALIYQHLPLDSLSGIVCYSASIEADLQAAIASRNRALQTATRPNWYFR